MSDETIIELSGVFKLYKRGAEEIHACNGINLAIKKGEFLSIVGPSGSGKSTLLNIVGCVDKPTGGIVKIKNRDVTSATQSVMTEIRRKIIGFVFQQFFLIPTLTAVENTELPGLFANNTKRQQKANELLSSVGLSQRGRHLPSQMSGGEMQRVAIARALINSPDILLADEPTGNLDSSNARGIFKIFDDLNKRGLTVVVVTHNMELAKIATRVVLLEDGKIKNS